MKGKFFLNANGWWLEVEATVVGSIASATQS